VRCNDFRPPRAQAGFTLLELLLTVVVMGVLLAVAIPSFQSIVQGQHNTDITTQFAQDLAWAQGTALSGQTVVMTINADGSWGMTQRTYDKASGTFGTMSFPGHSMTSAQLQADDPGVSCALIAGSASQSCKQTLSFTSIGTVHGLSPGVFQYTSGTSKSSFQVFASGTLVPNPSYAS
jgi:prepilin-type N-terminal cleavage/methylation domain-containing protein